MMYIMFAMSGRSGDRGKGRPDQVRNARQHGAKVLNDENIEEALIELDEGGEAVKEAENNPKKWLRNKGVQLPGDPSVEIKGDNWSISLCWKDYCLKFSTN